MTEVALIAFIAKNNSWPVTILQKFSTTISHNFGSISVSAFSSGVDCKLFV